MRVITYSNPLPGSDFLSDLRYVVAVAAFFKKVYPSGEVYCATYGDLPDDLKPTVNKIHFPFNEQPFALSRVNFLRQYVKSEHFTAPTLFIGRDVLVCRDLEKVLDDNLIATNYRYHGAMPYCSDFIYVRPPRDQKEARLLGLFFTEWHRSACFMPPSTAGDWCEQLALCTTLGMPEDIQFSGAPIAAPRKNFVTALPADPYFLTPEDFFTASLPEHLARPNGPHSEAFVPDAFANFISSKYMLHFKGDRKYMFWNLVKWSIDREMIDVRKLFPNLPPDYLLAGG